jgi:hypothetical protein
LEKARLCFSRKAPLHEGVEVDCEVWLLIEKGVITEAAFPTKIPEERATSRESSSQFGCTRKCPVISVGLLNDWSVFERMERLEPVESYMV